MKYPKVLSNPKSAVVWEKQFSLKQQKFERFARLQVYVYQYYGQWIMDPHDFPIISLDLGISPIFPRERRGVGAVV